MYKNRPLHRKRSVQRQIITKAKECTGKDHYKAEGMYRDREFFTGAGVYRDRAFLAAKKSSSRTSKITKLSQS